MRKPTYIFSSGRLERRENTLKLITEEGKKVLPINAISEIYVFGEIELNKRVLEFLSKEGIPVHFFNRYGYYTGSYYPREKLNSGLITLKQAEHYLDFEKRLYLAKSFVIGGINQIIKNLNYYAKNKDKILFDYIRKIEETSESIKDFQRIESIMQIEGEIRKIYYEAFDYILNSEEFTFEKRTKRPPKNPINALISFGNSLIYTTILAQIYQTHLDPRIGYLHETNRRSFSLNLDLAEIFKPLIVDKVIFTLINRKQIALKHFEEEINYSYLNEKGKKIFIKAFEEKLNTTFKYKNLGKVSYKKLIKLECYKLYKHFLEEQIYIPYSGD